MLDLNALPLRAAIGQFDELTDEQIAFAKQCGVADVLLNTPILPGDARWEFKDQWADRPLQLEYFGEHMAGERFFDLLDRIRKKGARKADPLEVFCMSLILGFQGKYKLRGREELDNLIRDIVQETNNYRGRSSSLAPHWQIPEEPVERPPSIIPRWVLVTGVASLVLVIALFIILALWLNSDAAEAGSRMIL